MKNLKIHSRVRALLFLAVAALLVTACFLPASVSAAKKRKKKKRKKKKKADELPEVSVSRYEYCHSCIAVVEQFHKAVEDIANSKAFKRDVQNNEINGTEIAAGLCDGEYFEHYTDQMRYGCYKLLQEHWNVVIGGMRGERARGERNRVLEHKRRACVETEACIGHMADKIKMNVLPEKTRCNACKAVVGDIDWLLFREKQKVPRRVRLAGLLEDICQDIAIRHDDSNYLEELCDDLIDGMIGETLEEEYSILVRSIKLRKSLEGGGLKLSLSLQEKVCEELGGYCEKGAATPESEGADAFGPNDADKKEEKKEEAAVVTTEEEVEVGGQAESSEDTTEL
jgi:hypothetical protein